MMCVGFYRLSLFDLFNLTPEQYAAMPIDCAGALFGVVAAGGVYTPGAVVGGAYGVGAIAGQAGG